MASLKIAQLQRLQQNMQVLLAQKQQLEMQLAEFDSALTELKNTSQAYKIIGQAMIASDKNELSKELEENKERAELRLKSIAKQEEQLQQNMKKLQAEIVGELKNKP